jgi:hypothetical protein
MTFKKRDQRTMIASVHFVILHICNHAMLNFKVKRREFWADRFIWVL